jgi:hypothetical protein
VRLLTTPRLPTALVALASLLLLHTVAATPAATAHTTTRPYQHPFHATALELDWNPDSHCFEAALQLPGTTLEEELTRIAGRPVNLDNTKPDTLEKNEQLLRDWIRARLKLSAPNLPNCEIHWVGFETEKRSVYAYFEIRPPSDKLQTNPPRELDIHCSFFQHIPGQINAVTARTPQLRGSAILTDLQPSAKIPLAAK